MVYKMASRRNDEPGVGLWGCQRGTAAVEFVVVVSLLTLLLFSMVELALLFQSRTMVVHAARDGARRAAIAGGDTAEVRDFIDRQLELGRIDLDKVVVEIRPRRVAYGSTVYVTISYSYEAITPFARNLLGGQIPVSVEVLSRAERLQ